IFYGNLDFFREALATERGACIFGYKVRDPERYGVVEFAPDGRALSLEEKPKRPRSSFAVPGLYVYDNHIVKICRGLRPSARCARNVDPESRRQTRRSSNVPIRLEPRLIRCLMRCVPQKPDRTLCSCRKP